MKSVLASARTATLVAALAVSGPMAHAGGVVEPVIEPVVIVEDTSTSSAGIIVPILTIALIALVLTQTEEPLPASDARLKTDITPVGLTDGGLTIYNFRYIWSDEVHTGVMAQEVLQHRPDAILPLPGGFMGVDYDALGLGHLQD